VEVPGGAGTLWSVWAWPEAQGAVAVADVAWAPAGDALDAVTVTTHDGTSATHHAAPHGWHIALAAGAARSSIDLEGLLPEPPHPPADPVASVVESSPEVVVPRVPASDMANHPPEAPLQPPPGARLVTLGAGHYIGTELPWEEAGAPTAQVALAATAQHLVVTVTAHTGPVTPPDAPENPLDNERPEVNASGVQWYLGARSDGWAQGGIALPVGAPDGRQCPIVPGTWSLPTVRWQGLATGWRMRLAWPLEALPRDLDGTVTFDLVINERPPERARRRGQLALSGGGGFGYLRGDRHDPGRAWRLRLPGADAPAG
jgi:hypothetical protein